MDTLNRMSLTDHVILITGAAGGLGGTAAIALAKHGARIILLDKNIPKMEQVYDAIVEIGGPDPALYPFDLAGAKEDQYQEMANVIAKQYGSLQGLLHSAVDISAYSPVMNISTREWGHTLNVNLNATFLLSRILLPVLQKSTHASVVFTSDSSARKAPAYSGAYGVSKIAVEGFARILAEEMEAAQKIRINTLIPGPINSPLRKKLYPAENKTRLPTMNSLDNLYYYLFSEQSLGVTGQTFDAQTFKIA